MLIFSSTLLLTPPSPSPSSGECLMCGDTVRAQEQSREEADGGAEQWDTLRPAQFLSGHRNACTPYHLQSPPLLTVWRDILVNKQWHRVAGHCRGDAVAHFLRGGCLPKCCEGTILLSQGDHLDLVLAR